MRCSMPISWAPSNWAARSRSPIADDMRVQEDRRGGFEPPASDDINEAGQAATATEALSSRRFSPADEIDTLRRFKRAVPERLPRRRGYRRMAAKRGFGTRLAQGNEGSHPQRRRDFRLPRLRRKPRRRNILLHHRRLGLHEGAHGCAPALCPCPGPGGRPHRGVHHRHAADARDTRLKLKKWRAGAGVGFRPRLRLGRRHAHRRCPAGLPRIPRFAG